MQLGSFAWSDALISAGRSARGTRSTRDA
jgi:hypothetical protein